MELWWRLGVGGRHSLIFVCRARRPPDNLKRNSGIWGPLRVHPHCFTCPQPSPYWVTFGRRSSTSYRPWEGSTRLGSGVWWVRVCVCVAGRTRGGKGNLPAAAMSREREQEIIMYIKGALQSPIKWHATRAHRSSMLHHIPIHDNWAGLLSICQYVDN